MSWKFGYARVSRDGQTPEQQITALKAAGCKEVFVEIASGANDKRPKLKEMMGKVREGDAIVIWKLDRLARSLRHLTDIAADLKTRGIQLVSLTDSIDTTTASGELHFNMLAAIAQFERALIIERTNAGLDRARSQGRIGGRPKLDQDKVDVALANIGRGMSKSEAARQAKISRSALYRALSVSKTSAKTYKDTAGIGTNKDTLKRHLNGSGAHSEPTVQ